MSKLDLISKDAAQKLDLETKFTMIIDRVKKGTILVLEGGLSPEEQTGLINRVMMQIEFEEPSFAGVELISFFNDPSHSSFWRRSKRQLSFTVVAPSSTVKILRNDNEILSLLLKDSYPPT